MFQPTDLYFEGLAAAADEHVAAGNFDGPLSGCKVILFSNAPSLSRASVLADLTECVYTGYARSSAVVWGSVQRDTDNGFQVNGDAKVFQATAPTTTPDTAKGYAIISSGGSPQLLGGEMFQAPVAFVDAFSAVTIIPNAHFGGAPGNWGAAAVIT